MSAGKVFYGMETIDIKRSIKECYTPLAVVTIEEILGLRRWVLNGYASMPACNLYEHATEEFHYECMSDVALWRKKEEGSTEEGKGTR